MTRRYQDRYPKQAYRTRSVEWWVYTYWLVMQKRGRKTNEDFWSVA